MQYLNKITNISQKPSKNTLLLSPLSTSSVFILGTYPFKSIRTPLFTSLGASDGTIRSKDVDMMGRYAQMIEDDMNERGYTGKIHYHLQIISPIEALIYGVIHPPKYSLMHILTQVPLSPLQLGLEKTPINYQYHPKKSLQKVNQTVTHLVTMMAQVTEMYLDHLTILSSVPSLSQPFEILLEMMIDHYLNYQQYLVLLTQGGKLQVAPSSPSGSN